MKLSPLYKKSLTDSVLFLLGFLIVYPLSFRSLMALDQGIIFEAGARIAHGQIPFRDFYLPIGIVPSYLQAVLFKIFGISWKVYASHACIISGLTAVIIFRLLQLLTPYPAGFRLFISLFSTCFFYTIPATPYADNHSMFFCLAAIYSFVLARYKTPRYLYITPLCLVLGFLSKQNPTSLYLLLFSVLVIINFKFLLKNYLMVVKSTVLTILICLFLLLYWSWEPFWHHFIQLPSEVGSKRFSAFNFNRFRDYYRLSHDGAKYLIWLLPISVVFAAITKINDRKWNSLFIGTGIFTFCIVTAFSTSNQQQNAYSFITLSVFIFLSPLYAYLTQKRKIYAVMFGFVIMLFSLHGLKYKVNFVVRREFNDLKYNYVNEQSTYHENLGLFHQACCSMGSIADYDSIIHFLKSTDENFIWFGDASFIGSMIGNESVIPLIFYHPGLTYPFPEVDPQEFNLLKKNIYRKMGEKNTKYLVMESEKTYMGATLQEFWSPLLPYAKVVKHAGQGRIYEIDPQFYKEVALRNP